jgi:membrane-associated phospholipid phosphatase
MLLPTHVRPLHNAALNFRLPLHLNPETLNHWSSFPSDHASVFFAIATTIFLVNRRIGVLAFVIATGLCLVRIYLGLHYLSDIVGGAALGVLFVALTQPLRRLDTIRRLVAPRTTPRPLFYAAAFYLCFGVTTLFSDYRDLASGISPLLKAHLHH